MRWLCHSSLILFFLAGRAFPFAIRGANSGTSIYSFVKAKDAQSKMGMSEESKSSNMGDPTSVITAADTAATTSKGPPQGGPPQSKGGPPSPTTAGKILEAAFEIVFKLLYIGDETGIRDSSKNLRVLWTRALLNNLGKINDPVANELLPRKSRFVVGKLMGNLLWKPLVLEKLDWIVARTQFIDSQLDEFIRETNDSATNRQVILLGSGYDTRSMRYTQSNIDFYEVDIPEVISKKSVVTKQYLEKSAPSACVRFVPLNLNEVLTRNTNIVQVLETEGFQSELPTIVICEAVLFYLIPGAVQKLILDLFSLNANRYCITDNLSKLGVAPGPPVPTPRQKCEAWVEKSGKELVAHDSIWGGAIHFVGIK